MSSFKDFAAGVYLPVSPSPPMTPYPPLTHCIRVCIQYIYSHREGGRVELERRLEGPQFTTLGCKYQHD